MLKIGLSIAALVVAGVLFAVLRDDTGIPSRFPMVCVATGEIFELSIDEAGMIPAKNPRTGERTLIFCERGEDGQYAIAETDRWMLEEGELAKQNAFIDLETLKVKPR